MAIPIYAGAMPAARDADWLEFADCYEADEATPRDFTGLDADISLRRPSSDDVVARLTTQAGTVEVTWETENGPLNRVQARWPAAAVAAAGVSGQYVAEFRIFVGDGSVECVGRLTNVTFG